MLEQGQQEEKGLVLSAAAAVAEGLLLAARWHARAGRRQASQEALSEAGRVASEVAEGLHQLADAPEKPPPTDEPGGKEQGGEDRSQDEVAIRALVRAQMALFTQLRKAEARRGPDDEEAEDARQGSPPGSPVAEAAAGVRAVSGGRPRGGGGDLLGMLANAYKRQG